MGLINAGILAGLATLAIPVAIHLLRSRQYQPAIMGSLRFLQQALQQNVRWRRLQNLLLLLLRLLIVALLTLLFARPFLEKPNPEADDELHVLVLLDTSASMSGVAFGTANLELAQETAQRVLTEMPEKARVSLATFAEEAREVETFEDVDVEPVGHTDYGAALLWGATRLQRSERARKRIILITDLQETGVPVEPMKEWHLDTQVVIESVPQAGTWNAGIDRVKQPTPYARKDALLEVNIAVFGSPPEAEVEDDVDVLMEIEDREPAKHSGPLSTRTMAIPWHPTGPGRYTGTVRMETGDAYAWDDVRPFSIDVKEPMVVHLVNGEPGQTRFADETYFLRQALAVPVTDAQQVAFETRESQELGDLSNTAVVALCNVPFLQQAEITRLRTFVQGGGGLAVFLGDAVEPDDYEPLLRAKLIPGTLKRGKVAVPRRLMTWDAAHPALALFSKRESGDLSRIVFRDVFDVQPNEKAVVLAQLDNDRPALIGGRLGKGRILLVTNPCDREWSDWPAERAFLPLMRELFAFLSRGSGVPGEPAAALGLNAPDSARETDIRALPEEEFRARLGIGAAPVEELVQQDPQEGPEARAREDEIWPYLALGLLAALMLENTLADRGRS
ncbi:MAG: VWA domain-containing protein [Lentisphaerae bacterium]|nr:VWA domain-containing protein [Lentisphaerota bacterium]